MFSGTNKRKHTDLVSHHILIEHTQIRCKLMPKCELFYCSNLSVKELQSLVRAFLALWVVLYGMASTKRHSNKISQLKSISRWFNKARNSGPNRGTNMDGKKIQNWILWWSHRKLSWRQIYFSFQDSGNNDVAQKKKSVVSCCDFKCLLRKKH